MEKSSKGVTKQILTVLKLLDSNFINHFKTTFSDDDLWRLYLITQSQILTVLELLDSNFINHFKTTFFDYDLQRLYLITQKSRMNLTNLS